MSENREQPVFDRRTYQDLANGTAAMPIGSMEWSRLAVAAFEHLAALQGEGGDWRWVPAEPTPEMVDAGALAASDFVNNWKPGDPTDTPVATILYRAMLSAAPQPKEGGEAEDEQVERIHALAKALQAARNVDGDIAVPDLTMQQAIHLAVAALSAAPPKIVDGGECTAEPAAIATAPPASAPSAVESLSRVNRWPVGKTITPRMDLTNNDALFLREGEPVTIERMTGSGNCLLFVRGRNGREGLWAESCFTALSSEEPPPGDGLCPRSEPLHLKSQPTDGESR